MTSMSIFDDKNEVQPQSINWGKVGDNIAGTKIAVRHKVPTKYGPNSLYSVKAEGGSFTDKNGATVTIKPGEVWDVWGRNDIFNAQMDRMQIGQKFGLKFTESRPSDSGNDLKMVKLYTIGEMDTEWLEAGGVVAGE